MADEDLGAALRRVQLCSQAVSDDDAWIDDILEQARPRKRRAKAPKQLKEELEREFLTPPTEFSDEWLRRLQQ